MVVKTNLGGFQLSRLGLTDEVSRDIEERATHLRLRHHADACRIKEKRAWKRKDHGNA